MPSKDRVLDFFLRNLVKSLLWLRYRIRVSGLDELAVRGRTGILFLPNHPALIDPIIMMAVLNRKFRPRALADADQVDRFFVRWLAKKAGVRTIPDITKYGGQTREAIEAALAESIEGLRRGENLLLYPAGHLLLQKLEDLGASSAVEVILRKLPGVRVVLVRTRGLWGSAFSWGRGHSPAPEVARLVKRAPWYLLANFVFLMPRRGVKIEMVEPPDLPRAADRNTLNRYLERFYNQDPGPNTYVPYTIWGRPGRRELPEPVTRGGSGSTGVSPVASGGTGQTPVLPVTGQTPALPGVRPETRQLVTDYLRELTGARRVGDEDRLANDLGMDSLARADLLTWLQSEFGFPQGDTDSLQTVGDVLLAASGEAVAAGPVSVPPAPKKWLRGSTGVSPVTKRATGQTPVLPAGQTIAEVFLNQARRNPNRVVIADQTSGAKSYREIVAAVMVLGPIIRRLEGQYVGIMLPASVAANIVYLATVFAGKTPVLVNWTVGRRNLLHGLDLLGVRHILTASLLVKRIQSAGTDLTALKDRFVRLEGISKQITLGSKLAGLAKSRLSWSCLKNAPVSPTAAVLFTSGSESLPKAVPLSHGNILANIRDVLSAIPVYSADKALGMLPPFHSFGLTVTMVLPLCAGLPVVYHANPTQGAVLGRLIEAYKVTMLIGTPTFLAGIVGSSRRSHLATLRLAVTGAERCPPQVYGALAQSCPRAVVLEGYGVTECSPIISVNDATEPRPGTIGKVLPSFEYAIVGVETGHRVEPGRPGMLLVRGPCVFNGYLNHDGPSPFVDFEGKSWYRTGDLVSQDVSGVLTFVGRLKRFVKLGGEMISLPAIEAVLEQGFRLRTSDLGVARATRSPKPEASFESPRHREEGPTIAVESTPDERHPELVLFTTLELSREQVNRQIQQAGLSPLHNIRRVLRLEAIPTLGTGKTDYKALKAMLKE